MTAPVLFQNMPPLSLEEYSELEASVREHGIQVPIIVDEDGVVVDGHHRQKIAEHLGIDCPKRVLNGKSESEKRTLALSLNVHRRHLTRDQKRALIAESLKADPQLSNREHGRRVGVDHKTVDAIRVPMESRGEIPHVSDRTDTLGRSQPATRRTAEFHSGSGFYSPGAEIDLTSTTTVDLDTGEVVDERPYARPEPVESPKQKRRAITDQFFEAAYDLQKKVERIERLTEDDRFPKNKEQIALRHKNDLLRLAGTLSKVLRALD